MNQKSFQKKIKQLTIHLPDYHLQFFHRQNYQQHHFHFLLVLQQQQNCLLPYSSLKLLPLLLPLHDPNPLFYLFFVSVFQRHYRNHLKLHAYVYQLLVIQNHYVNEIYSLSDFVILIENQNVI